MTARLRRAAPLLAAALLVAVAAPAARAWEITDPQSWFAGKTPPPVDKRVPLCDDPAVRNEVSARIAAAIPSYYDGLKVDAMDEVRQAGLSVDDPSPLARRYCATRLTMSSKPHQQPIHQVAFYMVEERGSFVGVSWGVEVCLSGRDAWRVYDGACRTVRPPEAQ